MPSVSTVEWVELSAQRRTECPDRKHRGCSVEPDRQIVEDEQAGDERQDHSHSDATGWATPADDAAAAMATPIAAKQTVAISTVTAVAAAVRANSCTA